MFGLLFTGGGLWFLQGDVEVWRLDWSWLWPAALLVAGVLVLLSIRSDARSVPDGRPVDDALDDLGDPSDPDLPWKVDP